MGNLYRSQSALKFLVAGICGISLGVAIIL